MSLPKPKGSLDNSCSVIHGNTLYTYTSGAFQSLKLEEGAKWTQLEMGEKVEGATCVGSTPPNAAEAGFFLVGGKGGSTGMQKYTYATGKWTPITLGGDAVTKDRQWHSSTYMPALNSIMVYGGTRDGTRGPGSETFVIEAREPYTVQSHNAASAPTSIQPILLSMPPADAFMVDSAGKVWLFNPTVKWRELGASLAEPVANTATTKAALVFGKGGSQHLLLFDLSKSPNTVSRVVIQNEAGVPMLNSPRLNERDIQVDFSKDRRAIVENFPEYNATFASKTTRDSYSMAQSSDNLFVFVGGNAAEPIAIFDANKNSWVDSVDFLTQKSLKANSFTTTTLVSSTRAPHTSTLSSLPSISPETTQTIVTEALPAASTSTAIPEWDGLSANTVLGITLGSIFSFLILTGLLIFFCRRRRGNSKVQEVAQLKSKPSPSEKSNKSFGSRVLHHRAPDSPAFACRGRASQESFSSVAILMGKVHQQQDSISSRIGTPDTSRSLTSAHSTTTLKRSISKPILREERSILQGLDERAEFSDSRAGPHPGTIDEEDEGRRSSGWNKYWSGGNGLGAFGITGKRNTSNSNHSSHYSGASVKTGSAPVKATQDSVVVSPLKFDSPFEKRQTLSTLNSVPSGSPVVTGHDESGRFHEGMSGKIERPVSSVSGYSSGIPESLNEAWGASASGKQWGTSRAPEDAYQSTFSLGVPPAGNHTGVSTQPQLAMASKSSDLSWLNLGDQNRDSRI